MGAKPKEDKTLINLQKKNFALTQKQKQMEEQRAASRRVAVMRAQSARDIGFGLVAKKQAMSGIQNAPVGNI